jgi:hypothetical protein
MARRSWFRWLWFWIPVILAIAWLARCAHAAEPQLVATPRAKALKVSATNRPFLAAERSVQPVMLKAAGYTEAEYLVTGLAGIYDWADANGTQLTELANPVPYTTRMLVRRPDAGKFSGLVVVELLEAEDHYDRAPLWGLSWQQFLRHGDVWVGVTVRPAAAAALRNFDPVRYGTISLGYNPPDGCPARTDDPRATPPDAGIGLAWDLIAQVGALLRSSSKENPLLDLNPRFVIGAGYGEAGAYITTYANALHAVRRRGDGAPIFDGYLDASGAQLSAPINQCAAPLPEEDPRRGALPRDVPFVTVMTESDFNLAPALRRADSDAPRDVFRLYEISGAAQLGTWPAGMPPVADVKLAGLTVFAADLCIEPASDLPVGLVFNAIWQQYAELLAEGRPMLSLSRIETLDDGGARHDEAGNASGGWRLPQLDEPLAIFSSHSTSRIPVDRPAAVCALTGNRKPFDPLKLKNLYQDRAGYLSRFNAAVDRAVEERRLVPEDGEALKDQLKKAPPAF